MRKHFIAMITILSLALILAGCGGSASTSTGSAPGGSAAGQSSGESINIKVGTVMSENAPGAQALMLMRDSLAENSDGRIHVEIYFGGQLGGELEMVEQARSGDIQMATSNHMNISNTINSLAALESYFLFDDYDHAFRFQDSEGGQAMLDAYNEMGLQGLGYFPNGFRQLTNSKRPITSLEDLRDIKIRGYSEVQISAWESVNVALSAVAWNELFTAMQQSLIDGQECAISSIYEQKFYEVQKYMTMTSHLLSSDILVCNQQWLAGLNEADRAMIETAVKEAVDYHRTNFVELENSYNDEFRANGMEINELDPSVRQQLSEKMNAAVNPTIVALSGQETLDLVIRWAEETR